MGSFQLYRLSDDPDRYAGFNLHEDDEESDEALQGLAPIAANWSGLQVEVDDSASTELGDFPFLFPTYTPVFSNRAVEALKPLIQDSVEILPLGNFNQVDYFVIHVLEEVDALDPERSEFLVVDGEKASITKFVFHEDRLVNKHIFRIPEVRRRQAFVSADFKKCVERNRLTGAVFIKVT